MVPGLPLRWLVWLRVALLIHLLLVVRWEHVRGHEARMSSSCELLSILEESRRHRVILQHLLLLPLLWCHVLE